MLKIYLSSVIIWMIINYSATKLFGPKITENGWLENKKATKMSWIVALFVMSAIPVFRLLIPVCCFIMGSMTKEQFDEWIESNKNL